MILAIYVLQFSGNCIIIPSVKKLTLQIVFFTNPLLIIYTPLEAVGSSPVDRFTLYFAAVQNKATSERHFFSRVKADIHNPLRYLLITDQLLRSLSGVACIG